MFNTTLFYLQSEKFHSAQHEQYFPNDFFVFGPDVYGMKKKGRNRSMPKMKRKRR